MDDMKISFKVEITGCSKKNGYATINCPNLHDKQYSLYCYLDGSHKTVIENMHKLTKTCPMVRAQFEALE